MDRHCIPPAILLGGDLGALSMARCLGTAGVRVYAINYPTAVVRHSRFCRWVDLPGHFGTGACGWREFLLGRESDGLRGGVLLAASDEAIELVAKDRDALLNRYRLDLSNPPAQLAMLDKLSTYQIAAAADVPTPRFWVADTWEDILKLREHLLYPLILKPLLAHQFRNKFRGSYSVVSNLDDLRLAFARLKDAQIRAFLVEMIPGPDSQLSSYYTYLDEDGNGLLNYTKRIIRRYPAGMGSSTYHISDHVPEIRELSLALFRMAGLRGIANAEFKFDDRDGRYKLIECNARFTAADSLLARSGLNLSLFVYKRIIGQDPPVPSIYQSGVRLWKPTGDFAAFRQLRRMGQLSFRGWIGSILHRQLLPVFCWRDPVPAIVEAYRTCAHLCTRISVKGCRPIFRAAPHSESQIPLCQPPKVTSCIEQTAEAAISPSVTPCASEGSYGR